MNYFTKDISLQVYDGDTRPKEIGSVFYSTDFKNILINFKFSNASFNEVDALVKIGSSLNIFTIENQEGIFPLELNSRLFTENTTCAINFTGKFEDGSTIDVRGVTFKVRVSEADANLPEIQKYYWDKLEDVLDEYPNTLTSVTHDETLLGDGTVENPLSVVDDGSGDTAKWGGIVGTLSNQTDLQDSLDVLQAGISDLNTYQTLQDNKLNGLETDVEDVKVDVSNIETQLTNVNSEINTIQTDIGSVNQEVAETKTELENTEDDLANLNTVVQGNSNDIQTLQQDVSTINNEIDGKQDVSNLKTNLTNANDTTYPSTKAIVDELSGYNLQKVLANGNTTNGIATFNLSNSSNDKFKINSNTTTSQRGIAYIADNDESNPYFQAGRTNEGNLFTRFGKYSNGANFILLSQTNDIKFRNNSEVVFGFNTVTGEVTAKQEFLNSLKSKLKLSNISNDSLTFSPENGNASYMKISTNYQGCGNVGFNLFDEDGKSFVEFGKIADGNCSFMAGKNSSGNINLSVNTTTNSFRVRNGTTDIFKISSDGTVSGSAAFKASLKTFLGI